ncbi:hypothetical protein K435DRAFT_967780 [Dendrothele bispora CBS 962.96]|uniref:PPP4R2-domain-containing protein n=1 Tax=Dendrothele bispora (strain CBS 962.96) TaxID=1314807 RepID=A0A4V4HES4_DENBC|nr:hypothetical protein K435DRAFT_967780 [Dendrothele bispora CBS 962.96]
MTSASDHLQRVAADDQLDIPWPQLRDLIKQKLEENIKQFLAETRPQSPPPPFLPISLPNGSLKLAPFPPRTRDNSNMIEAPVNFMNEDQAAEMRGYIFTQLDEFDSEPPFTIQRVCELCVSPRKHYKSVGKYLRAFEKSLLVTSTQDSFPLSSLTDKGTDASIQNMAPMTSASQSTPTTPLFSPIPFLHEDARRSKSRSPPPSPLALSAAGPVSGGHPEALETKALGLVDELDDPSPGHMSEQPVAITSVTSGPIIQNLESRFVKAETAEGGATETNNEMAVDENKENTKS